MPTFSIKLARSFAQQGDYGKSIANWFAVLKCQPALKSALKLEFLDCLSQFICDLEKRNRRDQAVDYFLMAQQLYPDCSEIFVLWGQFLFRNELMEESTFCFCKALDLEPMNFRARQNLRNLSSHVIDQWHFRMLNDTARNFAYERAISMALCNSSSGMVLDIGAGTGLLRLFELIGVTVQQK